ncbi:hypothetical protein GUITHDRAFT_138898 [Guillardia theta CCMP2712]|uniref:Uncharacterized protein n=1 Tax=Guillardia theta (strain CCMP2712) TaxID=905079 RepID=L1JC80_GUITC|nr:hypothetical protein GUITHDRAFT_138898 [Guillardia theta CCMP2712]EKX45695.1 hypothetical protein GUITHDRAFT_138898 [Guillardia theta CCMP2712]|eukprot:XP_005832675.1 hypothetical protein GUITHDRAFT_138898 [Guillardia theta CCMP2712]
MQMTNPRIHSLMSESGKINRLSSSPSVSSPKNQSPHSPSRANDVIGALKDWNLVKENPLTAFLERAPSSPAMFRSCRRLSVPRLDVPTRNLSLVQDSSKNDSSRVRQEQHGELEHKDLFLRLASSSSAVQRRSSMRVLSSRHSPVASPRLSPTPRLSSQPEHSPSSGKSSLLNQETLKPPQVSEGTKAGKLLLLNFHIGDLGRARHELGGIMRLSLREQTVAMSQKDDNGNTLLHALVGGGGLDFEETAAEEQAKEREKIDLSALSAGRDKLVKMGVDLNAENNEGKTAMDLCESKLLKDHLEGRKKSITSTPERTALLAAFKWRKRAALKLSFPLEAVTGAEPESEGGFLSSCSTPLSRAVSQSSQHLEASSPSSSPLKALVAHPVT